MFDWSIITGNIGGESESAWYFDPRKMCFDWSITGDIRQWFTLEIFPESVLIGLLQDILAGSHTSSFTLGIVWEWLIGVLLIFLKKCLIDYYRRYRRNWSWSLTKRRESCCRDWLERTGWWFLEKNWESYFRIVF